MSRPRVPTGIDYISQLSRLSLDEKGQVSQGSFSYLISVLRNIITKINGLLKFGQGVDGEWAGNLDAQWRIVDSPAGANAQFIVEHGLNRIPVHFMYTCDRAAVVYASDKDRASWNASEIYLKCNIVSARIYLIII